jgi:carbonic anhydrase
MPDRTSIRLAPRFDLGLRALLPTWRAAWSRATARDDLLAAVASLGPSFSIALLAARHAGLPATAALASAIVGSVVVALFGGATLGLAGPGLATTAVLVEIHRAHGPTGLALACALCGAFQLVLGALGAGRLIRLVPVTVVHAFALGIGATAVLACLPDALGLQLPATHDALQLADHLAAHARDTHPAALTMAALCGVAAWLGGRGGRRVPAALLAVASCTAVTAFAHLDVATLPDLPLTLPRPTRLGMPPSQVAQFARSAFVLFALTTAETLLSARADAGRDPGARGEPDQDLVGHGLANLLLAPLGGVPAAGSLARVTALRSLGGRTRAAAFLHGVLGLGVGAAVLLVDRHIPVAALAGVVVATAVPLLDPRPLGAVFRVSRAEAVVLAATALVMVFGDLLRGVEAGLLATLLLAMANLARFRARVQRGVDGAPHQVNLSGSVTFLATPAIDETRARLAALEPASGVILDVRSVPAMDVTGCEHFVALVDEAVARGARVAVFGAAPAYRESLLASDRHGGLAARLCVTERDVDAVLGRPRSFEMRAQVVANLDRYRAEVRDHYTPLFDQLADGQHPHTLFITCVDSRVTPAMLTGAHPGELFILRCLGAMVPPPGEDAQPAEGAAVEYAVGVLGVRNIVVCGHSRCGAVKAAKAGEVPDELPTLQRWLAGVRGASGDLSAHADVDDAARAITVRQLDNLRRFPQVGDRIERGELELHAWFYDVAQAELFEWSERAGAFEVMTGPRLTELPDEAAK